MGGDEFTVLLPGLAGQQDAVRVVERLAKQLHRPFNLEGRQVVVNASIGIAESVDGQGSADDLLRNADIAMYEAKKRGKGQYQIFAPEMEALAWTRLELEADLRTALERREFHLHYQPILDLDSGAVIEMEALLRWDHPRRGLLHPAEFIPLAEATGLIVPLGDWVLAEACREAVAWHARRDRHPPVMVSVNLSPYQLLKSQLVETVAQTLDQTGLDPARLNLEITESSMIQNPKRPSGRWRRSRTWACAWPSTTSAQASRASAPSSTSRSTA